MDGFSKLKELGSKTIASDTHIQVAHVESILNKEFEQFQKPQFFGFLSILEREYKVDLSPLKQEYLFARAEEEINNETTYDIADSAPKIFENKKALLKNKKVVYGAVGTVAVLLVVLLFSLIDLSPSTEQKIEINNTAIDQAKKNLNIEPVHVANVEEMLHDNDVESAEYGQDADINSSVTNDQAGNVKSTIDMNEPVSSTEPMMPLYLRIVPRGKLWLGIINAETHKRRVETITAPLVLDPNKNWLIVTGYGHLDMDCGDTTKKYREDNKLLFLYENGICQVIDDEEFKARNKGKLW